MMPTSIARFCLSACLLLTTAAAAGCSDPASSEGSASADLSKKPTGSTGTAPSAPAPVKEIHATNDPKVGSDLLAAEACGVKTATHPSTIVARVFETGCGDVAMNGIFPILTLSRSPDERVFDLGLNLAGIDKVSFVGDRELRIDGKEAVNPEDIKTVAVSYSVVYSVGAGDDAELSSVIKLTKLP